MGQIPGGVIPDLPDRVIAATAIRLNLPLVTRDGRIQAASIETIWVNRIPLAAESPN
ncbi:MAG: hypothetical protein HY236_04130 [Acidobacteria bacterium]|nr:hypothetical protein [Acidobacteriota bacterium]